MHDAERGLFDLMRGRPIVVATPDSNGHGESVLLAAVEGLREESLAELRELAAPVRLTLTNHRARSMGVTEDVLTRGSVSFDLAADEAPRAIYRLATFRGGRAPHAVSVDPASPCEAGGLALVRTGRLLPAVVSVRLGADDRTAVARLVQSGRVLSVTTTQIAAMTEAAQLEVTHVSEGPVPLAQAEDARFISFREANGLLEHVAVIIGQRNSWPDPLPVRIHSACLTGDLFGSLRCDCGEQLRGSLAVFAASGGGVLLYLDQEGRGIGFGNKLRAYTLQHEGLDTVDADCTLGFGADERRYEAAVAMLRHLDVDRIQLLTNNPEKIRAVRAGGIRVIDRQPLYGTLNRHNRRYVKAKVQRAGHWLGDMLSGAVPGK